MTFSLRVLTATARYRGFDEGWMELAKRQGSTCSMT
jgi:hypothetical protein